MHRARFDIKREKIHLLLFHLPKKVPGKTFFPPYIRLGLISKKRLPNGLWLVHLIFIRAGYLWLNPTLHVVNDGQIKTLIIIYH